MKKEKQTDHKQWRSRFNKAKAIRSNWEGILRESYDLFLPDRDAFVEGQKGNNRRIHLWDDTGATALQQFVNQLKNKLLPSQQRWCELDTSGLVASEIVNGTFDEESEKELKIELDRNTEVMFNYIWDSNFDVAALESLQDMAVSTGALMIQETGDKDAPLNFVSVPCDELVIEEDNTGDVKNVWREWSVKAEEIPVLWADYSKEDKKLQKLIEKSPTNKVNIIEGTVYDHSTGEYHYSVYTDSADCKFIFESKYKVSPWVIFRWNKSAGETWGRGPALSCKPTMGMLNQLKSDLMRNNAVHINPPAIINSGAFVNPTKVKIAPNQRIIAKSDWTGNTSPVQYLQNNTNFQLGQGMANEFRQDIRESFYLDFLGGINDPVRSATEISIREQQMLEQQVSAFSRLKRELIDKVIRRVYYILKRNGIVQDLDIDGKVVSITATSPLAQMQSRKDVESLMQYFGTMMQLGGEQGMAMAAVEVDIAQVPAFIADKYSVPAFLRMDEEKKKKQAQVIQQAVNAQTQPQQPQ